MGFITNWTQKITSENDGVNRRKIRIIKDIVKVIFDILVGLQVTGNLKVIQAIGFGCFNEYNLTILNCRIGSG
jgi:hypothetical protein